MNVFTILDRKIFAKEFHMNGLGFFGNNIGVARVYGMHFSKKRPWRAVLMTIPDNHKMA